ncbi:MAG: DNA polymerase III subunit delta [Pseudomonadota bacterium]
MKLSGEKAVAFAATPTATVWAALVFGEDEGVANDAAQALIQAWVGNDPNAEIVTVHEDDVKKTPADLFDALEARSLLGGARVIRIRANADKAAAIVKEVLDAGDKMPGRFDAKLLVTAASLQKKSKLRIAFETCPTAAALQLFPDGLDDVEALIRNALQETGLSIHEDALELLAANLPGHRRLVHAEIEKLSLYALETTSSISVEDVRAVTIGDVDAGADIFVNALFDRDLPKALDALDRLFRSGTSPITLIRGMQRETQKLLSVAALGPNAGPDAGMKLRPPVFRNQWAIAAQRAKAWPTPLLARVMERIYDLEYQAKQAGPIAETALRHLAIQMTQPLRRNG